MNYFKGSLLLLFFSVFCIHDLLAQRETRLRYIETYKELAIKNMSSYGIPASITLAQACLESADGNSKLAKEGNNHFGIKCHNWNGDKIFHDDDKNNECFRRYSKAEDSFRDHSEFLRFRDRYKFLFDLDPRDYKGWAYGLKKAGYATNPAYPQLLITIIEEYQLYKYDLSGETLPPPPSELEKEREYSAPAGTNLFQISLSRKIMERNGVPYIISEVGETWESLSEDFNLFTGELQRFNDSDKGRPLVPGSVIYIEAKKNRGESLITSHVIEEGETINGLSQRYAIKERSLRKLNNLKKDEEPVPGIILKLR